MALQRDPTRQQLDVLSNRLVELLKGSEDPMAEMRSAADRLSEAGLSDHYPARKESPETFVATALEDNPAVYERVGAMTLGYNPRALESPDALISLLLPGSSE